MKITCPTKVRKVTGATDGGIDVVRVTKKCPCCGATNIYRRIRKGGYHCNKCKQTFGCPTIEKIGRVL
jgi:ribosomal protein L37AE/L43A